MLPVDERPYWAITTQELLTRLETGTNGLGSEEAEQRQVR